MAVSYSDIKVLLLNTPPYLHLKKTNTIQILYLTNGSVKLKPLGEELSTPGEKICVLSFNQCLSIIVKPGSKGYLITVTRDIFKLIIEEKLNPFSPKYYHKEPLFLSVYKSKKIESVFNKILKEHSSKKSAYLSIISSSIIELLLTIFRLDSSDKYWNPPIKGEVWTIKDIVKFIDYNYTESFSLETLAEYCDLNSTYFSRYFKETIGIPLFEYINKKRIQKACSLLKKSDISIIDAALTVGYNNVSFFNRYFKRITGMSPREYRKSSNI